jgi:hypothetical protein
MLPSVMAKSKNLSTRPATQLTRAVDELLRFNHPQNDVNGLPRDFEVPVF